MSLLLIEMTGMDTEKASRNSADIQHYYYLKVLQHEFNKYTAAKLS